MKIYMIASGILIFALFLLLKVSDVHAQAIDSNYRHIEFVDAIPEGLSEKKTKRIIHKQADRLMTLPQEQRKQIMDQYRQDVELRSNHGNMRQESKMYSTASTILCKSS